MYSKTYCAAVQGIEGCMIQVEADISDGLPMFSLVGYLSGEVREARERVRVALGNSGFRFPPRRVTVNLSPADIRKDGTGYDLAIAIAILTAYGILPEKYQTIDFQKIMWIGELSLDGRLCPVSGVLPMVYTGMEHDMAYCVLPVENYDEAMVIEGIRIIGVHSLREAVELLQKEAFDCELHEREPVQKDVKETGDFSDVRGQEAAKRAAEVAAAGMHNMLLIGPPGSGKSMLASRMAGILPTMTFEEQMEISRIYSVAGLLSKERPLVEQRPFRSPHHTITQAALIGGGRNPSPGEVSLASGGVLFLDELPEFERNVLEVLRQPLEEGSVVVSRVHGSCQYPAHILLLAAMNPCPCGWFPDRRKCHCSSEQVRRYMGRISGPLMDRIDICTETVPLKYQDMDMQGMQPEVSESTAMIRQRVEQAQQLQIERYRLEPFIHNSELSPKKIREYCSMTREAAEYLELIFHKMEFSARAYHKILRVARTIADLAGSTSISKAHISEAVCYRSVDRKYWEEVGRDER